MTNTSSTLSCGDTCSPKGSVDPTCGCSGQKSSRKAKAAKYGAGFFALCALCCAIPPALIALGVISIATGAYFSAGSTVALFVLTVLGLGYVLIQYLKKNR